MNLWRAKVVATFAWSNWTRQVRRYVSLSLRVTDTSDLSDVHTCALTWHSAAWCGWVAGTSAGLGWQRWIQCVRTSGEPTGSTVSLIPASTAEKAGRPAGLLPQPSPPVTAAAPTTGAPQRRRRPPQTSREADASYDCCSVDDSARCVDFLATRRIDTDCLYIQTAVAGYCSCLRQVDDCLLTVSCKL